MVAFDKSWAVVHLKVNGATRDVMFPDAGNHIDRSTATTVTVVKLQKGDTVRLQVYSTSYGGNYLESNLNSRCSFSGYKLA